VQLKSVVSIYIYIYTPCYILLNPKLKTAENSTFGGNKQQERVVETSVSKYFKMEDKESLRKLFLDLGCEIENDAVLDKCKYFQDLLQFFQL